MPSVMIVGATGGIGAALVEEYARRGWRVGLLGRDAARLDASSRQLQQQYPAGAFPFAACDVRNAGTVPPAFAALCEQLGALDLVIYAAGVMKPDQTGNAPDFAAAEEMFAVNTVGAVQVLGLAAAYMQRAGHGHLAAIGSIAGERGRKGNAAYGASKAALHTYLEGLRNRLHPTGIHVSTIKPGFVKTRMLGNARYPGAIAPAKAAGLIAGALERHRGSFFVPFWWSGVALAVRLCPSAIFKRFGPP